MKKRTGSKKKIEAAEKQFSALREKIERGLSTLPANAEKRKKKKKEIVSKLSCSSECEALGDIIFDVDSGDDVMTCLSKAAGVPDLFENIHNELKGLQEGYVKKHICYDVEMDAYTKVYADTASLMKGSGKEDLEILMAILAENTDNRRYP